MKQLIFAFILFFLLPVCSFCQQEIPSRIEVKNVFGGCNFYMSGEKLNNKELLRILSHNDLAYIQIKQAMNHYKWGSVFGYSGGFLLGWELGTLAANNKFSWEIASIGGTLAIISVPLTLSAFKKSKKAIDIFNNSIDKKATGDQAGLRASPCIISHVPCIRISILL